MVSARRVFERRSDDTQTTGNTRLYDLPTLTVDQLLASFQEMQISVSEQDLLQPTAERVEQIFVSILRQLVPRKYQLIDSLRIPNDTAVLGEDTGRNIRIYGCMHELLKDIGFTDFNLTDMTNPAAHRLARIMSALVNFAKFRDQRWEIFEKRMFVSDRLLEDMHNLDEENTSNENRLAAMRDEVARNGSYTAELQAESERMSHVLRELAKELDEKQAEYNHVKKERGRLKDEMVEAEYLLLEKTNEHKPMKEILESNPQNLPEVIDKLKKDIQLEEQRREEAMQQLEEEKRRRDNLHAIAQNQDRARRAVFELKREMNECLQYEHEAQSLSTELHALDTELESIRKAQQAQKTQLNLLGLQIETEDEKLTSFKEAFSRRLKHGFSNIENIQEEKKQDERELAELQKKVDDIELKRTEVETARANEEEQLKLEYEALTVDLDTFLKAFDTLK